MSESINKERELAANIIDKYVRRALAKAIEKGYAAYPFTSFVEGVVVDGQAIRYAVFIEGSGGKEKYAIDVLEDRTGARTETDMEEAKDLSSDGKMFARYVRAVLAHIDSTVKSLPVVKMVRDSFNEENLEGVMENAANLGTCFVLKISGRKGDAPIIGQVPAMPIINRNNCEQAGRLYMKNGADVLTTPELEHFRYLAAMLPLVKETRLIGELSEAFNMRETPGDGCQAIEAAYIKSKGFEKLESLLETRFGDFSRLTREQQEMFLKNSRVLLGSMDDRITDNSGTVRIRIKGCDTSKRSEKDYLDFQALDIRIKKKRSLEPIVKLLRNILWSFGKVHNEVRSVSFSLEVPVPDSWDPGDPGEETALFTDFVTPSGLSARPHLADVLQSVAEYALFTTAADIVSGRVDRKSTMTGARERHSVTRNAFIDACAKALPAIVERIASGPNEKLVKIMRGGENPSKKKVADAQLWRKKIVDAIVASSNALNAVAVNENRAGNYIDGDIECSVPLAIDSVKWGEIHVRIRTLPLRRGYKRTFLAGPVELVEDPAPGSDSRTYPMGSLGGGTFNETKAELAALFSDIVEKNPESKTARCFREKPGLLCSAIVEGYKKCAEDFRTMVRQKTLTEKEEYYRIFQEEFPEELMEGYCRMSG